MVKILHQRVHQSTIRLIKNHLREAVRIYIYMLYFRITYNVQSVLTTYG